MRAGNFVLNEQFIANSPKGPFNINEIVILYEFKSAILDIADIYAFHLGNVRELHEDLHIVEEAIQEAFGFPVNRDYHRFWEWPYCECPKLDNQDSWGTNYHYYSGSCPIHRDHITQENWKDKFFEAVEESVAFTTSIKKISKIDAWKAVLEGKKARATVWQRGVYVFLRGSNIVISPDLSDFNFNNQYYETDWEIIE